MSIPKGYKLVPVELLERSVQAIVNTSQMHPTLGDLREFIANAPAYSQPIYDETKERELFEAWAPIKHSHYLKPFTRVDGKSAYTRDEVQQDWAVWKACAQSRAKSVEAGHE